MMRPARPVLFLLALLLASAALAAEAPIPPSPKDYVTDTAGFLSSSARRDLDARLSAYDRATGHQIVVWIGRTTGGTPIEDWAVKAFEKWKIGRKGIDDGILLAIMADDHKLKIEVGYGLEGAVPDITAGRIINDVMAPQLRAGDRNGAVTAGVEALIRAIGGEGGRAAVTPPPQHAEHPRQIHQPSSPSLLKTVFVGLAVLIFLFILITNPSLALYLIWVLSSGGRGGGGGGFSGGGGGGFSGGGGRSGGGGASGSW